MDETRIFLSYDSRIGNAATVIDSIRGNGSPRPDVRFVAVLSTDSEAAQLDGILRDKIGSCHGLLALVDSPNAFVGWEIGVALAVGIPVALSLCGTDQPQWITEGPLQQRVWTGRGLEPERLCELAGGLDRWQPSPGAVVRGDRALVLCPQGGIWTGVARNVRHAVGTVDVFDIRACPLDQLQQRLAGVGHCAWVIPEDATDDAPNGDETAWLAIVAGYLHQSGVPVKLLRKDKAVRLSCLHCHTPWSQQDQLLEQLAAWVEDITGTPAAPVDPIDALRARLHRDHRPRFPWLRRGVGAPVELVPVELEVVEGGDPDCLDARPHKPDMDALGILELLSPTRCAPDPSGRAPRWLVAAEPGAGKTTMLRYAVHRIADPDRGDTRVPLLLSLADIEDQADPLLAAAGGDDVLLTALRAAVSQGQALLLLDGFDEVRGHTAVYKRIQAWSRRPDLARIPILVTTRPVAVAVRDSWPDFTRARINYLDSTRQKKLVQHVLGDDGDSEAFWQRTAGMGGFAALARNPFLLTLAAVLLMRGEQEEEPIRSRAALLSRAVDDCLRQGWGAGEGEEEGHGVQSPGAARELLAPLSLALQQIGGEAWKRDQVETLARDLLDVPKLARYFPQYWESDRDFLNDLHHKAGLIGPLDGLGGRWRYLHRSFRELLAADALVAHPQRDRVVKELVEAEQTRRKGQTASAPARSGEVVALMAARLGTKGRPWLDKLSKDAPDVVVRALPACDWMGGWERVRRLVDLDPFSGGPAIWDNDSLDAVIDALGDGDVTELWATAGQVQDRYHLGVLWYALERAGECDLERFLGLCGLAGQPRPELEPVPIPVREGWVGSPEGVGGGGERPHHLVRFSRPYALGRTPVTNGQYAPFDPAKVDGKPQKHSVVRVSWFEARLFAAWVGGRLPTEAEWEVACRAGTDTRWWFGDDKKDLAAHAAMKNTREAVGQPGRSNAWGLSDMHGNVNEWTECRGWWRYTSNEVVDPAGPETGGWRGSVSVRSW